MNIGKLSYYSHKIHRLLVVIIVILGLIMMTTGATMKYPQLIPIDPTQARHIHNTVSTYFSLVFGTMILTGLIMYITPWLIKTFRGPPKPTNLPN